MAPDGIKITRRMCRQTYCRVHASTVQQTVKMDVADNTTLAQRCQYNNSARTPRDEKSISPGPACHISLNGIRRRQPESPQHWSIRRSPPLVKHPTLNCRHMRCVNIKGKTVASIKRQEASLRVFSIPRGIKSFGKIDSVLIHGKHKWGTQVLCKGDDWPSIS